MPTPRKTTPPLPRYEHPRPWVVRHNSTRTGTSSPSQPPRGSRSHTLTPEKMPKSVTATSKQAWKLCERLLAAFRVPPVFTILSHVSAFLCRSQYRLLFQPPERCRLCWRWASFKAVSRLAVSPHISSLVFDRHFTVKSFFFRQRSEH